jgi:hypothetical protein
MTKREALALAATATAVGATIGQWPSFSILIVSGVCGLNLGMAWSARRSRRRYEAAQEKLDASFAQMDELTRDGVEIMADMVKATRPCPSCGFCQVCGKFHEGEEQVIH